jgi:aminoglycoside phosphotransferase (APT) family kinase protein
MTDPPFDQRKLERYLVDQGICRPGATLRRIGDGHSNLTYLVDDGTRRVVVRRPPPPPIPPGGHDVLREARIQRALADTAVPIAPILAIEATGTVMESPFYVMEYLDGVVASTTTPATLDNLDGRRGLAETLVDTLAELHRVDYRAAGLDDFGTPSANVERHIRRFARIVDPDGSGPRGELGELLDWLIEHAPAPPRATIVHGDYRLGNVMLARNPPARILAVLDWELATIGDPLRDLGYFLATYAVPGEPLHALTELSAATLAPGYPDRRTLLDRYARAVGLQIPDVGWYIALALWKLAVLFEYQGRRFRAGVGDPYYGRPDLVRELLRAAGNATTGAQ